MCISLTPICPADRGKNWIFLSGEETSCWPLSMLMEPFLGSMCSSSEHLHQVNFAVINKTSWNSLPQLINVVKRSLKKKSLHTNSNQGRNAYLFFIELLRNAYYELGAHKLLPTNLPKLLIYVSRCTTKFGI
jgi:hypothetical protein